MATRFAALEKPFAVLEVGPGGTLCKLTAKCAAPLPSAEGSASATTTPVEMPLLLQTMRHPRAVDDTDAQTLSRFVASLWQSGYDVDWAQYHAAAAAEEESDAEGDAEGGATRAPPPPARCEAPTYSFEPTSFWKKPEASMYVALDAEASAEASESESESESDADPAEGAAEGASASAASSAAAPPPPPSCLVRYAECATPRVAMYCLPYAGGSSRAFQAWARAAPAWLDVVAIELPGRGARTDEALCSSDADDAVEAAFIATSVADDLARLAVRGAHVAVALTGMSMGANMCVELAHRLRSGLSGGGGGIAVQRISIIGRAPPALSAPRVGRDDSFEHDVASYALASAEVQVS